jgi:hypothetical protein
VEPYKLALKHAAFQNYIMERQKERASQNGTAPQKTFERGASITVEPPHHPGVANIRGIVSLEPQSSRGAAYMRNSARIMKVHESDEKRDYGKEEKFKLKRRCSSIIIEDDRDIQNLEVCCFLIGSIISN